MFFIFGGMLIFWLDYAELPSLKLKMRSIKLQKSSIYLESCKEIEGVMNYERNLTKSKVSKSFNDYK